MKIELRKLSRIARMSNETECFSAEVLVDGVLRGTVENAGRGGAHLYRPHTLEKLLDEHAKTLPKVKILDGEEPYEQHADLVVDRLVLRCVEGKRLARMLKTKVVFERQGKIYAGKVPPKDASRILNEMPFDDALTLFLGDES